MSLGVDTSGQNSTNQANANAQSLGVGQIASGLSAAGGAAQFATPNSLYNLSPGENIFRALQTGASLPGSLSSSAASYMNGPEGQNYQYSPAAQKQWSQGMEGMNQLTDPSHGIFHNYLNQFLVPQTLNDSIAHGFGGNSGATGEAITRAMSDAAMKYGSQYSGMVNDAVNLGNAPRALAAKGFNSFAMPLAQQDYSNLQTGLNAAGMQRQSSLMDLGRVQQLVQSMLGMLPTSTNNRQITNQGPGLAGTAVNALGSLGTSLLSGGPSGFSGSALSQILKMFGNQSSSRDSASSTGASPAGSDIGRSMIFDNPNNPPSWASNAAWDGSANQDTGSWAP